MKTRYLQGFSGHCRYGRLEKGAAGLYLCRLGGFRLEAYHSHQCHGNSFTISGTNVVEKPLTRPMLLHSLVAAGKAVLPGMNGALCRPRKWRSNTTRSSESRSRICLG